MGCPAVMGAGEGVVVGFSSDHLVQREDNHRMLPEASEAFDCLLRDAAADGFELRIASAYRSFDRQLAIWNGKARGTRPVTDIDGCAIDLHGLAIEQRIDAILRFSSLPGSSRHHWGTDIDVFDAAALPPDYRVALSPAEVIPGGIFDALHCWLDRRIATGRSYGFYRPYDVDRGGVAPERWHLSYAPLAAGFARQLTEELLLRCWSQPRAADLCWREVLAARLPALMRRYVHNVAPAPQPASVSALR